MNISRITAIAERILLQLFRDRRASALVLIAPLLIMAMLSVVLRSEEDAPRVHLAASGSAELFVSELEAKLSQPEDEESGFVLVDLPEGMGIEEAIKKGEIEAVLRVPNNFIEDRASGKNSRLELIVEGSNPMRTQAVFSRFRKAVPDSLSGLPVFLPEDCQSHCADTIPDGPPKLAVVKIYGNNIDETMDFFTPVLPAFFAFFFVFLLSGLTFLKERTSGTAERILASPLTQSELISGYILGFLPAALVQSTLVILFARYVLGGPWGGFAVVVTILLTALVAESFGVFISAYARSEFQVFQFIPIVILPQLLLSGIIWPIEHLPTWLQYLAKIFPLTYAVETIRNVAIREKSFIEILPEQAMLASFVLLCLIFAAKSVKKSI